MTQTTATLPKPPPEAISGLNLRPSDILLSLVVTILAPMFLTTAGGDIDFARMAALETVNAYRTRNNADLIFIAQIIGFGLCALGSLSLSMADELTISMILRLRANANACSRSAEKNRLALLDTRLDRVDPSGMHPEPETGFDEASVMASVAELQQRIAEAGFSQPEAVPGPIPAPAPVQTRPVPVSAVTPAPTVAAASTAADDERKSAWAAAFSTVAAEYIADLPNLPPLERRQATLRAAALNSSANTLLSGQDMSRLKPGDLEAMMRPKPA